jgi:hypothetical protein
MIGLPAGGPGPDRAQGEAQAITANVLDAARRTGLHFNINVGVFVPKPHTPYQRAPQIGMEEAEAALDYIRRRLKPAGHRLGVSDPLVSLIEGVLSRGDERSSDLIEQAWRAGCRLDAWHDQIKTEVWRRVLADHPDQVCRIRRGWDPAGALPWDFIESGVAPAYLSREYGQSQACAFTSPCIENCTHPCGSCGPEGGVIQNNTRLSDLSCPGRAIGGGPRNSLAGGRASGGPAAGEGARPDPPAPDAAGPGAADAGTWRLIFSFEKKGPAVFHAHLSVLEIFSMAFVRADIPVVYSGGFNPLPRLEVVAPLSLGIASDAEIAAVDTAFAPDAASFADRVNRSLPRGFAVRGAEHFYIPGGRKKYSLSSLLWGFEYAAPGDPSALVPLGGDKEFRIALGKKLSGEAPAPSPAGGPPAGPSSFNPAFYNRLRRRAVLARDPLDNNKAGGESYFDVYRRLYPGKG